MVTIGSGAFAGQTAVTEIGMPDTVTSIEYGAFIGCTGLEAVTFPRNLQTIAGDTFINCGMRSGIEGDAANTK